MLTKVIFIYQEFTVSLDINDKLDPPRPEKLYIEHENMSEPSLVLQLDAPDWMVFSRIDNLENLSTQQQNNLFLCLLFVLSNEKCLGGKCMFLVNNHYLPLLKTYLDMDEKPSYPESYTWFKNVISFKTGNITFNEKIATLEKEFAELESNYEVIIDKAELLEQTKQLSRLLIDHAPWAGEPEESRRTYSETAMKHRLAQDEVVALAIKNKKTNEIDCFARLYHYKDIYYGGDLVIRSSERGKKLAAWFMYRVFNYLLPANSIIIGIAGSDELLKTYQRYGMEKIAEHPVMIDSNFTLVCKLFPKQQLLLDYHKNFPLPSGPEIIEEKKEEEEGSTSMPMHL